MTFFSALTSSRSRGAKSPRRRLQLESLEDRTVPSTLFVVPSTVPTDSTHFHDLASADAAAVSGTDIIQIEPNSVPGNATIDKVLTIQGDPGFGPRSLPQVGSLTLGASKAVLNNLSLSSVTIDNGQVGETITNSRVASIVETAGPLSNGSNLINGNTITSTVSLGNSGAPAGGDVVTNNAFIVSTATSATLLSIAKDNNVLVQNNTFTGFALAAPGAVGLSGIGVSDSVNVTIIDNDITLTKSGAAAVNFGGISVGTNSVLTSARISGNRINTNKLGTGITTYEACHGGITIPIDVAIANNNLVLNQVGISIEVSALTEVDNSLIDLGGGPLGSSGGNDFHGYTGGPSGNFAIEMGPVLPPQSPKVDANENIFSPGPNTVVTGVSISALDANHGFVDTLYDDFLKRGGSTASGGELDFWANQLASSGQGSVANGIIRSAEGYTRLVDSLYLKILGRSADASGEASWVSQLQGGATMEQIIAGFLGSTEYAARANTLAFAPGSSDVNYIQSLYTLLLGRTASASEVDSWLGQLASSNRSGAALGFLNSSEFRSDFVTALYTPYSPLPATSFISIVATLLNRPQAPTLAEIASWVNSGQDLLTIEANIASSAEFFTNG